MGFSKLIKVDQRDGKFILEFILDANDSRSFDFHKKITELTLKKAPSGTISWIGNYGEKNAIQEQSINTQFKKYRLEFIDSSLKDETSIDETVKKLKIYYTQMEEMIGSYVEQFSKKNKR